MRVAVVLFNLGGPDSLDSVEPFLRNLFSDSAILPLPTILRMPMARWIARRRAPVARHIYSRMGGRSPLLEETRAQADRLETALLGRGVQAKVFIAMRAWHPRSRETARAVAEFAPDETVLLPLYPQFSTTTSASSLDDWRQCARSERRDAKEHRVCCYPWDSGLVGALAGELQTVLSKRLPGVVYRALFSAHGLPRRTVAKGDPYQWQMERTAEALAHQLTTENLDWSVCYQSRIGPLQWLEPTTDSEIRRAGVDGRGVVIAPISFVSEHSETLVELDIDYARLASDCGVPHYLRVPTVRTNHLFIEGLAELVIRALHSEQPITCGSGRVCPPQFSRCGMNRAA